jgi:hypothetical protein
MSDDCVLLRDVGKDEVVTFNDVKMPPARLRDELWSEQRRRWPAAARTDATSVRRSPQLATTE